LRLQVGGGGNLQSRLCERKHFIRFCGLKLKRVCVFMAFATDIRIA
jgi:hypothetical protein